MKKINDKGKVLNFIISFSIFMLILTTINLTVFGQEINKLISDTLVNKWNLDETSGEIAYDSVGQSNGTYDGTTSIDTPYGKGREFESGDYIQTNTKIPIGEKTIRFKVKIDILNRFMTFFNDSLHDEIRPQSNCYGNLIGIHKDGKLYWKIFNNGTENIIFDFESETIINDSEWHDIVLTWDGTKNTNAVKMYIDDMNKPNKTTTATAIETIDPSVNLTIGKTSHSTIYKNAFEGSLSQIEIYNSAYNSLSNPTNLTATPSTNNITLNWDAVDSADSYTILRSTTLNVVDTVIASNVTETTYIDNDVESGVTYYYVVRTVKDGVESPDSNVASAMIEKVNPAVLQIKLSTTDIYEYRVTMNEVNNFIKWYTDRSNGTGLPFYKFATDSKIDPYTDSNEYLIYDKIVWFKVKEYLK